MHLTFQYDLRPTRGQYRDLDRLLDMTRTLYNAALEARISNWEYGKRQAARRGASKPDAKLDPWVPETLYSQYRDLTAVRRDDPTGYGALPIRMLRETLKRLDLAYQGFFRRVQQGNGRAGYPRFKPRSRWRSFGFTEFSGIRLIGTKLHFAGISGGLAVHMYPPLPDGASVRSAMFRRGPKGWSIALQIELPDAIAAQDEARPAVGLDWGVKSFATLSDGTVVENPRIGKAAERCIRQQRRALSRCRRGSNRRRKVKRQLQRSLAATANRRKTFLHQTSAMLARNYSLLVAEKLTIHNMTASAKGTMEEPGSNVRQKAGLNREMLDLAPAMFVSMLTYKAARAGGQFVLVDPRGTSQRCSACGEAVPKTLAQRIHRCRCGLTIDRDLNAARNILLAAGGVVAPGDVKPADGPVRPGKLMEEPGHAA